MWCPKCRNEYVNGITECADCGTPLVDSLPLSDSSPVNFTEDFIRRIYEKEADTQSMADESADDADCMQTDGTDRIAADDADDMSVDGTGGMSADNADGMTTDDTPASAAHAYVSKAAQKEDMKSTAYTFTLIGASGLVLLLLLALDVLPVHIPESTKLMMYFVMGVMLLIFLFIGIRSFGLIKELAGAAKQEDALFSEITTWFLTLYSREDVDRNVDRAQGEELLYFARYDVMKRLILRNYPDLEEAFLDHLIETLYTELF